MKPIYCKIYIAV